MFIILFSREKKKKKIDMVKAAMRLKKYVLLVAKLICTCIQNLLFINNTKCNYGVSAILQRTTMNQRILS